MHTATLIEHEVWCLATLEELENGLGMTDYYLTSRLGVIRNIPKQLRYLPHQYCGMELLNLPMETTVAQVNCLLQHYGRDSALGDTMTAAMEHLQLEIGVEGCPLGYSFQNYDCLATNTWAKSLWEQVQVYLRLKYRWTTMGCTNQEGNRTGVSCKSSWRTTR